MNKQDIKYYLVGNLIYYIVVAFIFMDIFWIPELLDTEIYWDNGYPVIVLFLITFTFWNAFLIGIKPE